MIGWVLLSQSKLGFILSAFFKIIPSLQLELMPEEYSIDY